MYETHNQRIREPGEVGIALVIMRHEHSARVDDLRRIVREWNGKLMQLFILDYHIAFSQCGQTPGHHQGWTRFIPNSGPKYVRVYRKVLQEFQPRFKILPWFVYPLIG